MMNICILVLNFLGHVVILLTFKKKRFPNHFLKTATSFIVIASMHNSNFSHFCQLLFHVQSDCSFIVVPLPLCAGEWNQDLTHAIRALFYEAILPTLSFGFGVFPWWLMMTSIFFMFIIFFWLFIYVLKNLFRCPTHFYLFFYLFFLTLLRILKHKVYKCVGFFSIL